MNLLSTLHVLASCLASTSETYQRLLNQPESYHCAEAGHTLRIVSDRYAQVVIAAIKFSPELEDEDEDEEEEDENDTDLEEEVGE